MVGRRAFAVWAAALAMGCGGATSSPEDPPDDDGVDVPDADDSDAPPVTEDPPAPEPVVWPTTRRLAVREVRNMLADLIGVEVDVQGFPQDPTPNGFDNQLGGATVTPQFLDRLDLAASAAAAAWADQRLVRERVEFSGDFNRGCFEDDLNEDGDTRWVSFGEEVVSTAVEVPASGTWRVQLNFAQYIGYGIDGLRTIALRIDGAEVLRADFQGEGGRGAVPLAFSASADVAMSAGRHDVAWELLTPPDDTGVQPGVIPCTLFGGVSVDHVDLLGPREVVPACAGQDAFDVSCFGEDVLNLARRAWRSPLDDAERADLDAWFRATWDALDDPIEALQTVAHRVLLSPRFLIVEDQLDDAGRRSAVDVAEQLALMAWASLPDDTLAACAVDGGLLAPSGPCSVAEQLTRMMDDPRATRMVRDLTVQWLRLDRVPEPPADAPDVDMAALHADMVDESAALVTTLLVDRAASWSALIDAPVTHVSSELAAWYGVEGAPQGGTVEVDAAAVGRHGLLGQGAMHAATSRAGRVLPVYRGAWIQDVLLCDPPLPPPPGIPVLEGDDAGDFDAHTALPGCASCHVELDPPGKVLSHFDAWGRAGAPVPSDDALPDGTVITDLPTLRAWIVGQDGFEACAVATVATSALGRRVAPSDPLVADWRATLAAQGGSLGALLPLIAGSEAFLAPRGEEAP